MLLLEIEFKDSKSLHKILVVFSKVHCLFTSLLLRHYTWLHDMYIAYVICHISAVIISFGYLITLICNPSMKYHFINWTL